jgi:hypothetical protein
MIQRKGIYQEKAGEAKIGRTGHLCPLRTGPNCPLKIGQTRPTKSVVVDERQIENVKKSLAPIFLKMPDDVISALIEKKGFEHVISIADQTAYQLNQGSGTPKNPIGYFVALTLQGMDRPEGYKSPEEKEAEERNRQMRTGNRSRNAEQGWNERIPLEMIKEFIRDFA